MTRPSGRGRRWICSTRRGASGARRTMDEVQAFVVSLLDMAGRRSPAVARSARILPTELSKWKNGKHAPSGYNLLKLMRAVGYAPPGSEEARRPRDFELGERRLRSLEARVTALEAERKSDV